MRNRLNLQVEFIQKCKAAISVQAGDAGVEQPFGDIVMFSCFALRQMHNMGTSHVVSIALAEALASNREALTPITTLLGPPDISLGRWRTLVQGRGPNPLENYVSVDAVELVPFTGQQGKKRFLARLHFEANRARLQLHIKGFNLLGYGINYYSPLSVGLLLKHLAVSHQTDASYLSQLSSAARLCGQSFLRGEVTSISQLNIGFGIATFVMDAPEGGF